MNKNIKKNRFGVSLIESLIAIFVVASIVFIFSNISFFLNLASGQKNLIHAYELAQEEIESLRNLTFDKLANCSNPTCVEADFLNIAYNQGNWQVALDSSNYVYEISSLTSQTALSLLPFSDYENLFDLEMRYKNLADSPANWQAGFYYYYQDKNNYHRLTFTQDHVYVHRVVAGVESEVYSNTMITDPCSDWRTFKISLTGNNHVVYRNGISVGTFSESPSSTAGKIALMASSVHAYFDDVKVDNSDITNGNFSTGSLGKTADGWERLGLNDLPAGQGKLTIQDYLSDPNVKEILVKVTWQEKGQNKEVNLRTLIGKYGVHAK